ncbi:alpha-L-fucosidase [Microbacterium thalassium]|uniref:alpha-L-fucosidase n=1 Tax=Microbacterium TaxID=33882 RepID=UPI00146F87BC|nr:alpha-L-fucosidase [Microbacterium thalassium]
MELDPFPPRKPPGWFEDAKLGIFIHWGPYSVPAWAELSGELGAVDPQFWFRHNPYAEWYANTIQISGSPAHEHHLAVWGGFEYDRFLDQWRAESFDPDAMMREFRECGARYVIPTTKHHDGVPLWDAPSTGERNAVRRGPRRDLIAEIAGAARRHGLRFGTYYSGGLDWTAAPTPPIRSHEEMYATRPRDVGYARYAFSHVSDLIAKYRPDVLWNDIDWPDAGKEDTSFGLPRLFRDYFAAVPEGLVNDRWGVPFSDFATSEYQSRREREVGLFEHTRGLGYSFGYNARETSAHVLSGDALIRCLVDVVARGGNLLLNVGPDAAGNVPAAQRDPLRRLGAWLSTNADAIYASRALASDMADSRDDPWVRWTTDSRTLFVFFERGRGPVRLRLRVDAVDVRRGRALSGRAVEIAGVAEGLDVIVPGDGVEVVALPLRTELKA